MGATISTTDRSYAIIRDRIWAKENFAVSDNSILNTYRGIMVAGNGTTITGNTIRDCYNIGIQICSATQGSKSSICNNIITCWNDTAFGNSGIDCNAQNCTLMGNSITKSYRGIWFEAAGNSCEAIGNVLFANDETIRNEGLYNDLAHNKEQLY